MDTDELFMWPAFAYMDCLTNITYKLSGPSASLVFILQLPIQVFTLVFTMCLWAPVLMVGHAALGVFTLPYDLYKNIRNKNG